MAKNTHLEHVEDLIIDEGERGGERAIEILKILGQFLGNETEAKSRIKITTKFDGAPAIVCGTDPSDSQFFVGTKSVFAKNDPKICKSRQDVYRHYNGDLANKLATALETLSKCKIQGILQGDAMFTEDSKQRTQIRGKNYITFRPNTITYAVDPNSPTGKKISESRFGIVFHTTYTGQDLQSLSASFGVSPNSFMETAETWIHRADFNDISGIASMSPEERISYDRAINRAKGSLHKAKKALEIVKTETKQLSLAPELKKFFNNYVKVGNPIPSVKQAYNEFFYHLGKEFDKAIDKNKTLKAQSEKAGKFITIVDQLQMNEESFQMLIASYMNIQYAKNIVIDKLQKVSTLNTFVEQAGDYVVTPDEGFVAISDGGAVKLVDRLEFSKLNFTLEKKWG